MEDNEQPPAPVMEASAPEVAERPLWELSRDEQRVLIITFVGGFASIIAGACVIGGAIALVRSMEPTHSLLGPMIFFTAVYLFTVVWDVKSGRRRSEVLLRSDLIARLALWIGFSLLLLVWIGVAAGIH